MRNTNFPDGVLLRDLEESHWAAGDGKVYEVVNRNYGVICRAFNVRVVGSDKIAIQHIDDRSWETIYTGDAGLAPYSPNNWNDLNHTREYNPEPKWCDDWF